MFGLKGVDYKCSIYRIDFWEGCAGAPSALWTKPIDPTTEGKQQQLRVLAEYTLMFITLKDYNRYFMLWLKRRGYHT